MKAFIVVALSMVACASASRLGYGGPAEVAGVSTGVSSQFRSEDNYGNYQFGYDEAHATGSTSRREQQHNGVRRGSYSLSDADGRQRTVHYIADASGFHATVQTNEPGVEPKDPADVLINKAATPAYAAPVQAYAAPAQAYAAPAPVPAPLAVAAPAPIAVRSYGSPRQAQVYSAPAGPQAYGAASPYAPVAVEAPTPRAFSYSFGSSHVAPQAYAAPAPIYHHQQHQLRY